jgi:hypothetical protein
MINKGDIVDIAEVPMPVIEINLGKKYFSYDGYRSYKKEKC